MKNYNVHTYVISMEFSAVNRRRPSCETPLGPGAKKDGCFSRLVKPRLLMTKGWFLEVESQLGKSFKPSG